MKAYVITIKDMPESVKMASRCIDTASRHGVEVEVWPATTAKDNPCGMAVELGFSLEGFQGNPYSRLEPCVATFLSHARLWMECLYTMQTHLILEHDAVFVSDLPDVSMVAWLCNMGKPSFGGFITPRTGFGPLKSKRYLPGAHAYVIQPVAARCLLERARDEACPTDVFISLLRFPALEEFYPWPVECDDSFSTIQTELGCRAKHNDVKPA